MKLKISLLTFVIGTLGIWFTADYTVTTYGMPGELTEQISNEIYNLLVLLGVSLIVWNVGFFASIIYGIKFLNKKYNEWADRRDIRKQKTPI